MATEAEQRLESAAARIEAEFEERVYNDIANRTKQPKKI